MRLVLLLSTLLTVVLSHTLPQQDEDFTFEDENVYEVISKSEVHLAAPLQKSSLSQALYQPKRWPRNYNDEDDDDPDVQGDLFNCDEVFFCASGEELCQVQVCDGVVDCPNADDEAGCVCNIGQFLCDQAHCLSFEYWCDGVSNCEDGADEINCDGVGGGPCFNDDVFVCSGGEQVCQVQVCDGVVNCPKADDEINCGCQADQFLCDNAVCLPSARRCDGVQDCMDNRDEAYC